MYPQLDQAPSVSKMGCFATLHQLSDFDLPDIGIFTIVKDLALKVDYDLALRFGFNH